MLDGYLFARCGEIEHVEDDGFGASVLAAMDGSDDFYQRFAFMKCLLSAVLTDDGQFALLNNAVVDYRMVMPAGLGAYGKIQPQDPQFGLSRRKIGQRRAVPTLGRTYQFGCFDCHIIQFLID